ncbi:cilia- and flagella-associated protein 74 [Babesia caballi]|uniref:Cilia- and flagella-associated protein 74 n=1 Tax=Babesia caballi TaxID=5871 RepID=A0AAV4LV71_BABCB|nr:cilia- and flagella-associated protein 74 [Babesia caballi]
MRQIQRRHDERVRMAHVPRLVPGAGETVGVLHDPDVPGRLVLERVAGKQVRGGRFVAQQRAQQLKHEPRHHRRTRPHAVVGDVAKDVVQLVAVSQHEGRAPLRVSRHARQLVWLPLGGRGDHRLVGALYDHLVAVLPERAEAVIGVDHAERRLQRGRGGSVLDGARHQRSRVKQHHHRDDGLQQQAAHAAEVLPGAGQPKLQVRNAQPQPDVPHAHPVGHELQHQPDVQREHHPRDHDVGLASAYGVALDVQQQRQEEDDKGFEPHVGPAEDEVEGDEGNAEDQEELQGLLHPVVLLLRQLHAEGLLRKHCVPDERLLRLVRHDPDDVGGQAVAVFLGLTVTLLHGVVIRVHVLLVEVMQGTFRKHGQRRVVEAENSTRRQEEVEAAKVADCAEEEGVHQGDPASHQSAGARRHEQEHRRHAFREEHGVRRKGVGPRVCGDEAEEHVRHRIGQRHALQHVLEPGAVCPMRAAMYFGNSGAEHDAVDQKPERPTADGRHMPVLVGALKHYKRRVGEYRQESHFKQQQVAVVLRQTRPERHQRQLDQPQHEARRRTYHAGRHHEEADRHAGNRQQTDACIAYWQKGGYIRKVERAVGVRLLRQVSVGRPHTLLPDQPGVLDEVSEEGKHVQCTQYTCENASTNHVRLLFHFFLLISGK